MSNSSEFTYRSARSGAITGAICAVVVIESVAVHFAVAAYHPRVAWTLTLTSLYALVWLVRDYRALGSGAVRVADDSLRLRIGRRFDISIPLASVARTLRPTFRDLPTPGTTQGRDFLNLTKPAAPNVLIVLDRIRRVRLMAGLHRDVQRVALKLDDPDGFLRAAEARRVALPAQTA
ncbi:MAG TPA: hypothetical protein VH539_21510 [Gemmatimonadaceae bacterium]|jgi:hypothetical protein